MTAPTWAERFAYAQTVLRAAKHVVNGDVNPVWIDDHRFWYERTGDAGPEYRVVDARSGTGEIFVTRAALAEALASILGAEIDADDLIVTKPEFDLEEGKVSFQAYGSAYEYTPADSALKPVKKTSDLNWLSSPDQTSALILRDGNLYLRDVGSEAERALTTDGSVFDAYGDIPAPLRTTGFNSGERRPEAVWSPDGRWILTLQTDDRHVPDLAVADYAPKSGVRTVISANKTSLPSDPRVTEFRMLAIEVETGRLVEARYPRLNAVRMNSTPIGAHLTWWSADSSTAYFVDIERGEQRVHVVAFDVASGATRIVFTEASESYVEVSVNVYTHALITPLPETNELIWYSERDGNGHLYLYDLATGTLRNAITAGPWRVREVLDVDIARREVLFMAGGIDPAESPYIRKTCAASFDGGEVQILSGSPGEHDVNRGGSMGLMLKKLDGYDIDTINGLSPSGEYFVETVSTVDTQPETSLRRRDGSLVALLETASGSVAKGWLDPEAVQFTAADGVTRTYGLLFKPFGHEPDQQYPIIDMIYGGPQVGNVPHASFAAGGMPAHSYIDAAHLASLGAYVLILDGRGTADREREFRTASHRAVHTASNLEDHVAAIRQLAATDPQVNLDRVGITGFSGGGYMTAMAALRFGDFFKVAVAGGGNYDQALFWHSWGERYHGAWDSEHYAAQAAKTYAEGLCGKLLLVHGLLDHGCHPGGVFQLVQALIEADKDFDLVALPRAGHEWTGYGLRRRWDYLATHLIGETPPPFQSFKQPIDESIARFGANAKAPTPAGVEE